MDPLNMEHLVNVATVKKKNSVCIFSDYTSYIGTYILTCKRITA